ncbi:adenylosuccinate lyase, partial [Patescibacteria group bacterium]|nr:adenylosuccinate lyase [Patescibacteria group bacterium]
LVVEIEYFIALSKEPKINEVPPLSPIDQNQLRSFYKNFSLADAQIIKDIESTTNHDVKAIEYFIKQKIADTPLQKYSEFIHFALTSEDINNIAYSLMWQQGVRKIYLPNIIKVYQAILDFAQQNKNQPMLSLTHGQSATPTTVGKEFLVFAARLKRQVDYLEQHQLLGKLAGATGTWSAQVIAYPEVDWLEFSKKFINYLGLEPNLITTQIEPHDSIAESYQAIERINNILIDFTRDVWLYISRGILGQKKKAGEVGSSTMPHKINPIQFENAEGNLGLANAYFSHLCQKLPVSRMQRDLSDSTVLRNQGVPLAHSLLANKNILKGLSRLTVNQSKLEQELDEHWEVLSEAIQTILRKVGYNQAYEKLKDLTRGQKITQKSIQTFINNLNIPQIEKQKLLKLTPQTYTGLAEKLVNI